MRRGRGSGRVALVVVVIAEVGFTKELLIFVIHFYDALRVPFELFKQIERVKRIVQLENTHYFFTFALENPVDLFERIAFVVEIFRIVRVQVVRLVLVYEVVFVVVYVIVEFVVAVVV